ncbi:SPX domain-containing protein 3 [Porphyridium purpureum]|uniref:SPX domain-containing protein 3 n=1 Tax=Porphyridium purpureum TaxID=35688 RepID=A0A5J4YVW5_PORPP|nr:SPX domain-containing protein 3 [Porphyridium purpureum]|eukprot:POR5388..scf227_4
MKFGKTLRNTVEQSSEEWRPHFIDYKGLKKMIFGKDYREEDEDAHGGDAKMDSSAAKACGTKRKLTCDSSGGAATARQRQSPRDGSAADVHAREHGDVSDSDDDGDGHASGGFNARHAVGGGQQELVPHPPLYRSEPGAGREMLVSPNALRVPNEQFMAYLQKEVAKVNEFYLDQEEEYIIRYEFLTSEITRALMNGVQRKTANTLKQKLINLHAELVLLENFSQVNYTGFRKILKKHDKKTRMNIQHTYLNAVLVTPFFRSATLPKLLDGTEAQLRAMDAHGASAARGTLNEQAVTENSVLHLRKSAPRSFAKLPRLVESVNAAAAALESGEQDASGKGEVEIAALMRHMDDVVMRNLCLDEYDLNSLSERICVELDKSTTRSSAALYILPSGAHVDSFNASCDVAFVRVLSGQLVFDKFTRKSDRFVQSHASSGQHLSGPWPTIRVGSRNGDFLRLEASAPAVVLMIAFPGISEGAFFETDARQIEKTAKKDDLVQIYGQEKETIHQI